MYPPNIEKYNLLLIDEGKVDPETYSVYIVNLKTHCKQ